jgi:UDP-N-acetylglucosamine transferase subunit ALG13
MVGMMLMQLPGLIRIIKAEHKLIEEIIQKEKVDFIVSDNRYGCYSVKVKSIFVGHQLSLQMPNGFSFLKGFVNRLHLARIRNFNSVWIPDCENNFRFSGLLAENQLPNAKRMGILSRFGQSSFESGEHYEIVAIISGPEPQRSIFESLVRDQLSQVNKKSLLVKGRPGKTTRTTSGFVTEVDHLSARELESVLVSADVIISRAGYSTIMDLAALGKRVILIPTPGQTEQEYLAQYLMKSKKAFAQTQNQFDLKMALTESINFGPIPKTEPNEFLSEAISNLLRD